jgi:membrane protein
VLRRTLSQFREDNVTDWAALIALVSILGLVGRAATDPLLANLGSFAPGVAHEILENALPGLNESRRGSGILVIVGLGGSRPAVLSAGADERLPDRGAVALG